MIYGNKIQAAYDKGITIGDESVGISLSNNLVNHCGEGLAVHENASAVVFNTVFAFNDFGLTINHPQGDNGVYMRNSVLWRNGIEIEADEMSNLDVSYCMVRGDSPNEGTNNFYRNAHFIDQWNDNFKLREDSPLIDAGWGTGCPDLDIVGAIRIDVEGIDNSGAGVIDYADIGIYEYGSTSDYYHDNGAIPQRFDVLEVYPNPFNNSARILFKAVAMQDVDITLYDIAGRELFSKRDRPVKSGSYSFDLNASEIGLSSGLYFITIRHANTTINQRIVFIK